MRDIHSSPRSIEIKHKRRLRKIRRFILCFILFIIIIITLSILSKNEHVIINNIIVNGNQIIDKDDIKLEINKNISGKYFYLFSRNNSFIYPHDKIYNNLLSNFPRIKSLTINRDNLKTLRVDITERIGSYLYCGESIPEDKDDVGENCYFINNDGFIFDRAPYFSGNVYFKYYISEGDNVVDPLGKQMIDSDQFHRLARFIDSIVSIGFNPIYIVIDKDNTNYLYLKHAVDSVAPKIIFKNNDDLNIIEDNLSITMKNKEFADEINSKYNTLLYIDLRFDNKVLYKFE